MFMWYPCFLSEPEFTELVDFQIKGMNHSECHTRIPRDWSLVHEIAIQKST